jgi:purine-binding chemotaxis protein CheW
MVSQVAVAKPVRLIKCGLGEETYALDMGRIQGIERADRLQLGSAEDGPVGRLPGPGLGIEVYSLAERLGRPIPPVGAQNQVVVLHGPLGPWGLLVDRVSQVIAVARDRVDMLPPIVTRRAASFLQGVVHLDGGMVLLLDSEALNPQLPPGPVTRSPDSEGNLAARYARAFENLRGYRRGSTEIVLFTTAEPQPRTRPTSFGLSKSQILEIVEAGPIVPVPAAVAFLWGLISWRSLPVPVLDLGTRLGFQPAVMDKRTRLMVIHGGDRAEVIAFPVRPLIRVLPLPIDHAPCRQTFPVDPGLTRGMFELKGETVVIPDMQTILG